MTSSNLADFKTADKIVAIAYVSSPTDAPAAEFSATAEKHRDDYLFGLSTDTEAAKAEGVTPPAIVLYRSFDDPKTNYPYPIKSTTSEELSSWLADLSIPIIDEVNAENYATYSQSAKPLAYVFLDPSVVDVKEATINAIKPIAAEYKSSVNFVWIDAVKFGDHAKALNLVEPKWPSFVIQDISKQLKYPLDQTVDFSVDAVKEHVKAFVDGKLQPSTLR